MVFIEPYKITVVVIGLTGLALFIQLIFFDVVGIRAKHIPGHQIAANHNDLLFRVSRAFANTNESVGIFMLLVSFAILSSANPTWLNGSSTVYLAGRIAHMMFYYLNYGLYRSISFGLSLIGLASIFVAGAACWI